MRLTTIGTGTAAPHPHRVQSGALVEAGPVRVLVDCGSGVVNRMAERRLGWESLTHVALTHFHADHTIDLPTLIFGWRYGLLPPREAPVVLIGPPGLPARIDGMRAAFGDGLMDAPPPITVVELQPGGTLELADGVVIEARKVPHTEESVAYSIRGGGRRIVLTGDTGFDPELGAWAAGSDVLLAECSLPEGLAIPMHLTPRQCGALAALATPSRLALTHFYPPVEAEPIVEQVAESFGGPVTLCEDGWSINLEGP